MSSNVVVEMQDSDVRQLDSLENGPSLNWKKVASMFVQAGSKEGLLNRNRNEALMTDHSSEKYIPTSTKDFIQHEIELYEDLIFKQHEDLLSTEIVKKIRKSLFSFFDRRWQMWIWRLTMPLVTPSLSNRTLAISRTTLLSPSELLKLKKG